MRGEQSRRHTHAVGTVTTVKAFGHRQLDPGLDVGGRRKGALDRHDHGDVEVDRSLDVVGVDRQWILRIDVGHGRIPHGACTAILFAVDRLGDVNLSAAGDGDKKAVGRNHYSVFFLWNTAEVFQHHRINDISDRLQGAGYGCSTALGVGGDRSVTSGFKLLRPLYVTSLHTSCWIVDRVPARYGGNDVRHAACWDNDRPLIHGPE
ncbi:hypothetical protein D3C84_670220 [compost metagenome]